MQDLYDSPAMQNLRKPVSEYEKEQALYAAQRAALRRPIWTRLFGKRT